MMNLQTATARELVAYYNAHSGRPPVKKFQDRATAERRCAELAQSVVIDPVETPTTAALVAEAENHPYSYTGHTECPHCGIDLRNGVGQHGDEVNGIRIKHEHRMYECLGCGEEFGPEVARPTNRVVKTVGPRPAMSASLKLDRRITHLDTGRVYANACQVWKAGLVSASQGDRLSALLYGAAKIGVYSPVSVNGQMFILTCAQPARSCEHCGRDFEDGQHACESDDCPGRGSKAN